MATAGVSTLGVKVGYGIESSVGVKPSAFTQLTRVNSVGGISLETEKIDASALEDVVTRYTAGRADSGGSFPVTINITNETIAEWQTLISLSDTAKKSGKATWLEVWSPYLSKAFFIKVEPPLQIPMSDIGQNELQTVEMTMVIGEYVGLDTAVEPTAAA